MAKENVNILTEIKKGNVKPVYLICGEEKFLIQGAVKQIQELLLDPSTKDFNLSLLDENAPAKEIVTQIEAYPIASNWRLVIVTDPIFFKKRKKDDPIDVIEKALNFENTSSEKCLNTLMPLLDLNLEEIALRSPDFVSAIDNLTDELGSKLTNEIINFFERLPSIAQQIDSSFNTANSKDDVDIILKWLQGSLPKNNVLLLVVNGSVDKRSKIVKTIQKVGHVVSFDPVTDNKKTKGKDTLYHKIVNKFSQFNKKITLKAVEELRSRNNENMSAISECINKLIDYTEDIVQITEKEVIAVVTQNKFNSIFDLTDAIGAKNISQALKSLHDVLITGEPPIKINSLIIRQFRLSLQAKLVMNQADLQPITKRTSYSVFTNKVFKPLSSIEEITNKLPESKQFNILLQHPYAAYQVFKSANSFDQAELLVALEKILQVDTKLKTSDVDPSILLEQLVCELCERENYISALL